MALENALVRSLFCIFRLPYLAKLIRGLCGGLYGGLFRVLLKSAHPGTLNPLVDVALCVLERPRIIYPKNVGT